MKFLLILAAPAFLLCGCGDSPEYGIKRDPALMGLEGKENRQQVGEGIKKENVRAVEEGDEPIFRTEDRY